MENKEYEIREHQEEKCGEGCNCHNHHHHHHHAEPEGWKDVVLHPDMPLSALVHFLNILNQRLVEVEDIVTTTVNDQEVTLTEKQKLLAEGE